MLTMVRKPVADPGIDETVKHLNPEKIDRVIKWVFGKEADARFRTYVETCTHCGLCNDACHYYRSYKRDPSYAPASKVSRTLGDILKKKGPPDTESIKMYARIAFAECNLCKRCSMYCPFGIDVSYLMALVRRICGLLGVVPQYLQDQAYSHMYTSTLAWLAQDDWIDTVQFVEDELRMEIRNARIPLDKKWTDVMYSPHSLEVKFKTNLLSNIAKILTVASVDWTMPSTDGWDGTNQAMHAGDYETMGMIERKHFQAALALHAKKILTSE
jgi:Fe-S oxidoreductase